MNHHHHHHHQNGHDDDRNQNSHLPWWDGGILSKMILVAFSVLPQKLTAGCVNQFINAKVNTDVG